eukprot:2919778-Prymnesium_polylepis.1
MSWTWGGRAVRIAALVGEQTRFGSGMSFSNLIQNVPARAARENFGHIWGQGQGPVVLGVFV